VSAASISGLPAPITAVRGAVCAPRSEESAPEPGAALGAGAELRGRERPRRRRPRGAPGSLPPLRPVSAAARRPNGSGPHVNRGSQRREPTSQRPANVTCWNPVAATSAIRDHFVLTGPAEPAGPVDSPSPVGLRRSKPAANRLASARSTRSLENAWARRRRFPQVPQASSPAGPGRYDHQTT